MINLYGAKIILDEKEYEFEKLRKQAKVTFQSLQFVDKHLKELHSLNVIIKRAKNSYIKSLTQEMFQKRLVLYLKTIKKEKIMPKITIDDIEYNTEDLTDNGKPRSILTISGSSDG